jgi:hypothetical protein
MKSAFLIPLSTLIPVCLLIGGGLSREAFAQGTNQRTPTFNRNQQVITLVCEANIASQPAVVQVLAISRSEEAPKIEIGSECAPALASALNAGFRVLDVQGNDAGLRNFYTLWKP